MLKEHPFLVTTSIPHDKKTITYDITKKNRSEAVGKVYKINSDGKAELPADGEEFNGVIIAVDDTQITAAYIFGGLRVPLAKDGDGDAVTVARGNKLVAGVDASNSNAKGYVKAATAVTRPDDSAAAAAVRTAVQSLADAAKGKGYVLEFDTTHALLTL